MSEFPQGRGIIIKLQKESFRMLMNFSGSFSIVSNIVQEGVSLRFDLHSSSGSSLSRPSQLVVMRFRSGKIAERNRATGIIAVDIRECAASIDFKACCVVMRFRSGKIAERNRATGIIDVDIRECAASLDFKACCEGPGAWAGNGGVLMSSNIIVRFARWGHHVAKECRHSRVALGSDLDGLYDDICISSRCGQARAKPAAVMSSKSIPMGDEMFIVTKLVNPTRNHIDSRWMRKFREFPSK
ncbi:hypothetical protein DFH07DRAFT_770326 [Mycena maculata]|uniref:Uncharacterized protein n=1 Tax=Mycena maculata TaxID=230809 RepID=A0AAD7NL96_9AGAR|nr:hypothetical protein DFH07DRAFT_770326 [Mycena maculata]